MHTQTWRLAAPLGVSMSFFFLLPVQKVQATQCLFIPLVCFVVTGPAPFPLLGPVLAV